MRILQIVQKPQRRGAEVFASQLGRELRHKGHQAWTAYLYPFYGAGALPLGEDDQVLDGRECHLFERLPGFHPRLLRQLRGVIDDFQPQVVQVNGARTVKYGAFARRFDRRKPWVLIYRNIGHPRDWVHGWARTLFYHRLVMPAIDGIVGVSQTTLQAVQEFYGLSNPVACIPNGVDPALSPQVPREAVRQRAQTPLDAPVMICVGSLAPEKRLDRLLRLLQRVRDAGSEAYLWVVGGGTLRPALEGQAATLGVDGYVRFLGVQADVASWMSAADLFVLTSDTEGMPAVLLEAGVLGLPVVSTRVGGVPECVLDGETGLLVDPQDERALTQAVLDLLRDQARRIEMGRLARPWIQAHFTMDAIAQRYVDFYCQVLDHVDNAPP